ncbi:MAG: hypothetical protein LBU91_00590 [Bacteroidales bacterium]|jgi:uncharacterized membrane protein|nr:hypothetical protein [Bacteroidales bacterium]
MKKEKRRASKGQFALGLLGLIACIVSIVMVITNPEVSSFQEFFSRSWLTVMLLLIFVVPAIVTNISAFSKK